MIEFLTAIALLCQVHPDSGHASLLRIEKQQLKCQQYYVKCAKEYNWNKDYLGQCVLKRRV